MGVIDVDGLLQPIDEGGALCGEDLEYDPAFGELERTAQGKAEHQMGDEVVPAEEPNWREARKQAIELLGRTKDLRVAMHLLRALVYTSGFPGLADGLTLLKGLLETYWDTVHPQLDPEDDNDPTMRVNILVTLCDREALLRAVRSAPLVSSKGLGRFGLVDIEIARGETPAPAGGEPANMATIDGAFLECDVDELQATAEAANLSADVVAGLDTLLMERVGAAQAMDFGPLAQELQTAREFLTEQLVRRGVAVEGSVEGQAGREGGASQPIAGEINSPEDVIRMLDRACDYYARHEPSSPVPLLLYRAKRLVSKSFMDIMRDLAPDGVAQVETIGGPGAAGSEQPESGSESW